MATNYGFPMPNGAICDGYIYGNVACPYDNQAGPPTPFVPERIPYPPLGVDFITQDFVDAFNGLKPRRRRKPRAKKPAPTVEPSGRRSIDLSGGLGAGR